METDKKLNPTIIIILGATGDLTWRKLIPAIYNLYLDKWIPDHFAVIGISHKDITVDDFKKRLHEGVNKFSRRGKAKASEWNSFEKYLNYHKAEFNVAGTYTAIEKQIQKFEKEWKVSANRIFYLAVPPNSFDEIALKIGSSGLAKNKLLSRIVIEKPFGYDLVSAKHLNDLLHTIFDEGQIYRIDHYLGKETVQNILAFRFANAMFEPIWNRIYIDSVQISVAEQLGVENRGNYYETAGALRDMIQNHLLQLLCLIAMEPPVSFEADEVRNRKVDVLNAARKIRPEEVHKYAVRGQYGAGWIQGKKVVGYRKEPDVNKDSSKETFAALKLFIDNWRWQGVPFYLRTGKRLNETLSVITIQFRPVPHQSFPSEATGNWQPNRLVLYIQPHMGIRMRFQAKRPGLKMNLYPVDMQFNYDDTYTSGTPEAYETLLLDIMEGDSTLFMRADQVEAAWKILMPVINSWEANPSVNFPNYESGMQGPEDAEALIAKDGHSWSVIPPEKSE
ncbi:MAG: glucose-6-phosphate dehydrogenase [Saprospiraceae bacterium]|uniref:Glucose-6-phosphate 1-dehydrogenase n=1 Tax=Candidatus Opimibacter skivensis TaxID=2982028 RepID=A0A9D7SX78_9BACT|nr:glucose-6-phosphate dehydrogenase [Candidatus Opimibacter skivensis]